MFIAFFTAPFQPLVSQEAETGTAEVRKTVFLPPEFYIGDEVELIITVAASDPVGLPAVLPDDRWVEIRDIRIDKSQGMWNIFIRFVCFAPEEVPFPELDFGAFILRDLSVPVSSLTEDGQAELTGIKPPVLIPGTRLLLMAAVAGIILVPLGLIFLVPAVLRLVRSRSAVWKRKRSFLTARRKLEELRSEADTLSPAAVYDGLNRIFRTLLSAVRPADFSVFTAEEIRGWNLASAEHGSPQAWKGAEGPVPEPVPADLIELLLEAEHIRYGGAAAASFRRDIERGLKCLERIRRAEVKRTNV